MKIAFWSEEGQSGTTSNMLACAEMFSILYPAAEICAQNLGLSKKIAKAERGKQKPSKEADFYFLDCGIGLGRGKSRILRQMDLVVVNVKQEEAGLNRFFLEDRHRIPNFLVLMGNYYACDAFDRAYLEREYRVESERLGVISNNPEFYEAHRRGKVRHFIKAEYAKTGSLRNEQLLKELERFSRKMAAELENRM